MAILALQTALLVAIAFVLGAVAGCLIHRFWHDDHVDALPGAAPPPADAAPPPAATVEKPAAVKRPLAPADDLKRIKGIGPAIEGRLNGSGVTTFAQIAAWKKADRERISQTLNFKGRIEREDWVGQARILARGGKTEFSERVAAGQVETSRGKPKKQKK